MPLDHDEKIVIGAVVRPYTGSHRIKVFDEIIGMIMMMTITRAAGKKSVIRRSRGAPR